MVLFGLRRLWDNIFYLGWRVLPQRRVFGLKDKEYEGGEIEEGSIGNHVVMKKE